jgi:mycoredoxin-dependent peroxiredoxin
VCVTSSGSAATGAGELVAVDAGGCEQEVMASVPMTALPASNVRIGFINPLLVESFMTAIESRVVPAVGQQAPDFTLPSTSGEKVTLSSLRGKPVLIAFFPLAFSGTCTHELCEMRDDHDHFVARGVTLLPISVDHTYSLKEYKAKHGMKVDLLSDFKRDVSRAYGVLLDDRFYANRAYFLLDRDGVIRWSHVEETPNHRREDRELLAAIDAVGG